MTSSCRMPSATSRSHGASHHSAILPENGIREGWPNCGTAGQGHRTGGGRSLEGTGGRTCCSNSAGVDAYDSYNSRCECDQPAAKLLRMPARSRRRRRGGRNHWETARKRKRSERQKSAAIDLQAELKRVCGVDLTSIDAIDILTHKRGAELGTDFSRWKDELHFSSWLGLSPAALSAAAKSEAGNPQDKEPGAAALRTAQYFVAQ